MRRIPLFILFAAAALYSRSLAQADLLTEIRDVRSYEVKTDGFTLESNQTITIHAVAAGERFRGVGTSVWILNAATREVVWKLRQARQRNRSRGLAEYDDSIQLPRGTYEAYFAAFPEPSEDIESFSDFVDFIAGRIFDGTRRDREHRDLLLTIHGTGQHSGREAIDHWQENFRKNSVVSLSALWDNSYVHQGFTLEKPMDVTIYAIGEARDEDLFDYGWIINAKTGARVWEMSDANTQNAGGATKNKVVRETIHLPAGQYAGYFVTDDSHSFRDWNAPPPYDPSFWGITIWVNDEAMRKYAKPSEYTPAEEKNVIVDLTRLRDHESVSKSFTLKKAMDVRIYALGEGRDRDMSDYGWITDASSRKKIWTMEYDETNHAGGDRKNRLVDKVIHLERGSYTVHFITDDSHSYRNWNSSPPFDPDHWGITVSAATDQFDPKDVGTYEETSDPSILASIVRVGDDERRRKEFTLREKSEIRIYALGEGSDGDMADYAWIEDVNSGRVVWEMRYRMTEPAGGAQKNRLFDGTTTLQAGKYMLFYETDGSHSYHDWNDSPPDDPESWGVTVSLVKDNRR